MTRRVWPFKPLTPLTESLEWATDVFRAKSAEQRIALRQHPRRVFDFQHFMRDDNAAHACSLVRNAQGGDGFWVPDWTQTEVIGALSSGTAVDITVDLSSVKYGVSALLWESEIKHEVITVVETTDTLTGDIVNEYTNAIIMPVFKGDAPEGVSVDRSGANINAVSIGFVLTDGFDISESTYPTYRSLPVMNDCPVIANGTFSEGTTFPLSEFSSVSGTSQYIRSRDFVDYTYRVRWHEFTAADVYALRQWLHSRKGRQKAFWLSSLAKDLEVSSISGTTVTVFNDVVARPSGYDIEIFSGGTSYYRQVTAVVSGSIVGGRATVDMTVDASLPVSTADRISYLRCSRFNADRIDMNHNAAGGTVVSVPCIEIPVP